MSTSQDHIPALDGLRGIGALLVLALHIHCLEPGFALGERGYLAVDFFFLLSGFVLAHRYQGALAEGTLSTGRYMMLRLVRLYPLIAFGLLLGCFSGTEDIPAGELAGRFVAQALLLPALWTTGHLFLINAPQWSLFFELLANFAQALSARYQTRRLLIGVVTISGILFVAAALHHGSADMGAQGADFIGGFPRVGVSFFGGLLLHRLWIERRLPRLADRPHLAFVALPLLILAAPALPLGKAAGDLLIIMILFPTILCIALSGPITNRLFTASALLGTISYPLYAVHEPFVRAAAKLGHAAHLSGSWLLLFWIASVALCLICAGLLEASFDRPARRLCLDWINGKNRQLAA